MNIKKTGSLAKSADDAKTENEQYISEIERLTKQSNPLVQEYISDLKKEITRLIRINAKQEAAHFSITENLKSELDSAKRTSINVVFGKTQNKPPIDENKKA